MIGKLTGIVDTVGPDWVLLDVNGVGYEVACSSRVLGNLPDVGETVSLSIETYVREDQLKLFGFSSQTERTWFRTLQSVQGVGAKVALAILSTLSISDIANAIALQDKAMVAQTPGVGPKVAQRIVSELKDKAPKLSMDGIAAAPAEGAAAPTASAATAEALSALTNLGYPSIQANAAIATVIRDKGDDVATADLIRLALKELSS